jgi:hypothetical protein
LPGMSAKAKMLAASWSGRRITISDDFGQGPNYG